MVISLQTTSSSFNFFPIYNYTTVIKRYYNYTLSQHKFGLPDLEYSRRFSGFISFLHFGRRVGERTEAMETLVIMAWNLFINFSLFLKKREREFFQAVPSPNEMFWCNSFHFSFSPHLKWCSLRLTKSMQRTSRVVEPWTEFCLPPLVPAASAPLLKGFPRLNSKARSLSPFFLAHGRYLYKWSFPQSNELPFTSLRTYFWREENETFKPQLKRLLGTDNEPHLK